MTILFDCSVDLDIDIDVERKDDDTGELVAYAGIGNVDFHIAAAPAGPAIHAALSGTAPERAATPGRIHCQLDVAALQAELLPNYEGKRAWLVLSKDGEIVGKSFLGVVQKT